MACAVLVAQMEAGRLDPAPLWTDLSTFDGLEWRGCVDIVAAGIPCQPYSVAGKQEGGGDPRDLVDEFIRVIGETLPAVVFVEEVPNFVGNWTRDRLPGFARLARGLSELAYAVEEPVLVRAEDVGAPHRRERAFILAYRDCDRLEGIWCRGLHDRKWSTLGHNVDGRSGAVERSVGEEPIPDSIRPAVRNEPERGVGGTQKTESWDAEPAHVGQWPPGPSGDWENWRGPQPAVCRSSDGVSNRVDRLRALGNAVVPQQAVLAWQRLMEKLWTTTSL